MRRQACARHGELWKQPRGGTHGAELGRCCRWVGRGAAEAPAQKNTMTNFFSRQSGPWQPPAEADARRGSDDEAEEEEGEEIAALASRLEVDDEEEEVMIDPTKRHRAAARPARRNVIEDDDDE